MDATRTSVKITSAILNGFYDLFIDGKNRPVFFDIDKTYPELLIRDQHFETIKHELSGLMQKNIARNKSFQNLYVLDLKIILMMM